MPEERDDRGRFRREHDDEEFVTAVREHAPARTREVAEAVGCTAEGARKRLLALEDAGRVQGKDMGAATAWMLPATGRGREPET